MTNGELHRPGRVRPRRTRRSRLLRDLVSEATVTVERLIMPHFVLPGDSAREPIAAMPGIERVGVEDLVRAVASDRDIGIRAVLLFGLALESAKDAHGSHAWQATSAVARATRALKSSLGDDIIVISDVCLCAYTDHGHCGVLADGEVANDPSLDILARMALAHADAGVDIVAPSDMMDGRVGAIRDALDAAGHTGVGILAYSARYASAYFGPFREAADSSPRQGDRRTYQMDLRNAREALREVKLDEAEGADLVMVKPALAYLDVIHRVRAATNLPLVAYNVSGEYSAVKAAAANGWLDEAAVVRENLTAMARAGADAIISYHARDVARCGWL
ncbi:MAG: porphobilinogen synthase [Gemmatimonadaceae bacterium]